MSLEERVKARQRQEMKSREKRSDGLRDNYQKGLDRNQVMQSEADRIEKSVTDTLKNIMSLWKDEQYGTLYDYGQETSKAVVTKGEFVGRMARKTWGLACCWETIRDIQVEIAYSTLVYATAKIGYKPKKAMRTASRTERYQMIFEDGVWRINLLRILYATD